MKALEPRSDGREARQPNEGRRSETALPLDRLRAAGNRALADLLSPSVQRQAVQRQAVQRQALQRQAANRTQLLRRLTELVNPGAAIWGQLNPHSSATNNCPATAAALDHYLRTGQVQAAPAGTPLTVFRYRTGPLSRIVELGSFVRPDASDPRGRRFRDVIGPRVATVGQFVVVRGLRPPNAPYTDDHWFVVVNAPRRGVTVLDAFGTGGAFAVEDYIGRQWFTRFQYYSGEFTVTEDTPVL